MESHLHLLGHQVEELGELDGTRSVSVHLVHHVLELGFGGVLAQRAHHSPQLLRRDSPYETKPKKLEFPASGFVVCIQ